MCNNVLNNIARLAYDSSTYKIPWSDENTFFEIFYGTSKKLQLIIFQIFDFEIFHVEAKLQSTCGFTFLRHLSLVKFAARCFFTEHLKYKTLNKATLRTPSPNPHQLCIH